MSVAQPAFVDYRISRSDFQGNVLENITDQVTEMKVSLNQDATASPWTFSGEMKTATLFQRYKDYVIPEVKFTYGDETETGWVRLGHYRVRQIPKRHPTSGSTAGFTAEDLTAVISRVQISGDFTVAAGTNVVTWLTDVLTVSLGFLPGQIAIPEIPKTPSLAATYHAGDNWLLIINNTLQSVGMRNLYMTASGLLTTSASTELSAISPVVTYDDGQVIGVPTEDHDDSRVKNIQTVRRITPGSPIIQFTAMNLDPSSPLYVYGPVGQLAGTVIDDPQIADLAAAETRAKSELSYGASFYNKVVLGVIPRLGIDMYQVVGLNLKDIANQVQLDGNWYQRTVDFVIGPPVSSMSMVLNLNRTEPIRLEAL